MDLPKLENVDVTNKKVLLRADLDVDPSVPSKRLEVLIPTLHSLSQKGAFTCIIGHRGRPEGRDESLSLRLVAEQLGKMMDRTIFFLPSVPGEKSDITTGALEGSKAGEIHMFENLRFDPREEANDFEFAKAILSRGTFIFDFYINEAFGVSHREHTSIVQLPKLLPHAAGFQFAKEVDQFHTLMQNPQRPLVSILSGVKKDKLEYLEPFKKFSDKVLVAGRLPEYLGDDYADEKVVMAKLMPDKEDITLNSIEKFEQEIAKAGTILVAGPIGKYEEEGHRQGTERVLQAVANSSAYKVAGGGDTEDALRVLNLQNKFDWISVGGGAMLEFLAKGTLPGIEALTA
jgi:phosphoglycerate kinase